MLPRVYSQGRQEPAREFLVVTSTGEICSFKETFTSQKISGQQGKEGDHLYYIQPLPPAAEHSGI